MTLKLSSKDYFAQLDEQERQKSLMPAPMVQPQAPALKPVPSSPIQAGLQAVEQTGGKMLTGAVKGISVIGQSILGALDYLENNTDAYDALYGKQVDGTYDKNAGKFHWDKVDDLITGAVNAGVSQGQRILQSENLSEFGQNAMTGVQFLKNLPGAAGEYYREEGSRAKGFATGVSGLALELLLDPVSLIGGVAYKGGAALATKGVQAGVLGERAADVIGRVAANAATGNWVGGAVAGGARETAFAARNQLASIANKYSQKKIGRAAATILEWGFGPNSLATNNEMRTVLAKYAALKEDLPKEMLSVGNAAATAISTLPLKQREAAQQAFARAAGASTPEAEVGALDELARLGLRRDEAAGLVSKFRQNNLRLIDIIQSASKDIPQLAGVSADMAEYHVRRSYRMFVDPRVKSDWLDYLVTQNTPGSWQIANTHLGKQLAEGLGVTDATVPRIDMSFGNPKAMNEGNVIGGMQTYGAKTPLSTTGSGEKQAKLQLEIMKLDDLIRSGTPESNSLIRGAIKTKERLTQQLEALDKMTAGLGPVGAATPKIARLQRDIDKLDNMIGASSEKNLDKLTDRRNTLQAQLENIINNPSYNTTFSKPRRTSEATVDWVSKQNEELARMEERVQRAKDPVRKAQLRHTVELKRKKISEATGLDYNLQDNISVGDLQDLDYAQAVATERRDAGALSSIDNIQSQWVGGSLNSPRFTGPFNMPTDKAPVGSRYPEIDMSFDSMAANLKGGPDFIHVRTPDGIKLDQRKKYMTDLQKMLSESDDIARSSLVGFRQSETGEVLANFTERKAIAKNKTLADIGEWTVDWANKEGISDPDELAKLIASTSNALTYIPGSREFVSMVREKGHGLAELSPSMRKILEAEVGVTKVDTTAMQDRTLDPIWHNLFGAIDNFSVNAAEQGLQVGTIAAKANMLSELKKRNLVYTESELTSNPEVNKLGGWVKAPEGMFDTTEPMWIQATNARAIDAIDRSLGDIGRGGPVGKALSQASNLFRRAALVTDPSAHAAQFLGNISMLQMMGMKKLFGDDTGLVQGMTHAFKSVMTNDDSFKDAVDAGLQVTQTILSGQQNAQLAQSLLTLPRYTDKVVGTPHGVMTNLFRIAQDIHGMGNQVARRGTAAAADVIRPAVGTENAIGVATNLVSPAAMFQVPDQMTRMFAYRASVTNKTNALVKANPWLANYTQDAGTRINWDAIDKTVTEGGAIKADDVAAMREAHKLIREEAAALANDVALNYSDVPLAVNYLAKTGVVPFIKFQYKATGRIMQFMDEKPWAFSPYYAAQRNLNAGLNPDPDNFEGQREGLAANVRDAMVFPTGGTDSMGRQEFIDASRWLPFGMYANAANGGGREGGLEMEQSNIVSTPIIDLYGKMLTAGEDKAPGQSTSAYIAGLLAQTFSPAGVGPGSRKIETLARAIEQSMHYVDEKGNVVERAPNVAEKAIVAYADAPENAAHTLMNLGKSPDEITESAKGTPAEPSADRPRTTVEQAYGRYGLPGVGFSTDVEKTVSEYDRKYDVRITQLKSLRTQLINNMGLNQGDAGAKQLENLQRMIQTLEDQKKTQGRNLILGE